MDRLYCCLSELVDALEQAGVKSWREADALDKIKAASQWIDRKLGHFIPVTDARYFDGNGHIDLYIDPVLAVTALSLDGTAILSTQYILYGNGPAEPRWENGPYTRITVHPDATQMSVWWKEDKNILLTGRYGKWEQSVVSGATVANTTEISASGTSLVVSDGSKIGLGMVLLIGTEQPLVTATEAPTDSTANLGEALDSSEEEIDVNNAALVNTGEIIRVDFEQMKIIDKKTNTLLVVRGWNGTAKTSHTDTTDVYAYRTYTVKRGINGTTAAVHANAIAISRYVAPDDVKYLCVQIAALMLKKQQTAATKFLKKTFIIKKGGEIFWLWVIP